ncbi:MAG TPA: transposase [Candidatus Udaeobacter sp.]|jgi:transposase-like protein|nr:transposase [Candidatus Udaeobacter sp.]
MAKARRKRHSYTDAQRTQVLSAAQKEGLTAAQVQKRFGVTPVTYYSWRKKSGVSARRGAGAARLGRTRDLTGQLRIAVQAKVRQILPDIVRGEVTSYLDELFGSRRSGRKIRV